MIDDGVGIAPNLRKLTFKLFGKLLKTASVNSDGIGVGLMIYQQLIKRNLNTIHVKSGGLTKGSTFTFSRKMETIQEQPVGGRGKNEAEAGSKV